MRPVESFDIGLGAEIVDQPVTSFQRLFGPRNPKRGVFRGHHAVQGRVAAVQPLDRGALRLLAELHRAAGHRQGQAPAARQFPRRKAQQDRRCRRRAETHEQAGGMKAQLDRLGRVGGRADPAHRLVAGANRRRQALAVEAVMRGQRQTGGDDRGARVAHRFVVGVVQFHAVGRSGVDECGQRRRQPRI